PRCPPARRRTLASTRRQRKEREGRARHAANEASTRSWLHGVEGHDLARDAHCPTTEWAARAPDAGSADVVDRIAHLGHEARIQDGDARPTSAAAPIAAIASDTAGLPRCAVAGRG